MVEGQDVYPAPNCAIGGLGPGDSDLELNPRFLWENGPPQNTSTSQRETEKGGTCHGKPGGSCPIYPLEPGAQIQIINPNHQLRVTWKNGSPKHGDTAFGSLKKQSEKGALKILRATNRLTIFQGIVRPIQTTAVSNSQ